jgi:hypothetical protein
MSQENPMERICKTCEAQFDPTFANQLNCAECKLKKTVYKQQELEAVKIPDASDYILPEAHAKRLAKHAAEILTKVQSELTDRLTMQDMFIVETVAETMLGLEQNWSRKVQNPNGVLIGGHFCDAIGSAAVEHTHRFPRLLGSATFSQTYQKFLPAVVAWSDKHRDYVSADLMADIHAAIDGKYILKFARPPAAPPPYPAEVSADEPGVQLPPSQRITRQKPCPYIDDAAQRFLDGT